MKQIRIMELRGTYKGGGGPDKTILLSAAQHDKKRFYLLVTYLRDPKDDDFQITSMAKKYGVPNYVEVFDRSMIDFRCLCKLNYYIKKKKIQIIHVHDLKTTLLGVLLKILNPKVKIMHTAHGWIVNSKVERIKQRIQFMLLRCYPFHIAVSKATKKILVENNIKSETIKVLHNSIDIDYWKKTDSLSKIKEEFGISKNNRVIGTIGRLSHEKDIPTFLKVAKNILAEFPNTTFFIVGDGQGGILSELLEFAKEICIEKSIIFTGHRTDLKEIYSAFDIFLSTSLTEGIPNTILEAMSLEVPVIATKVGGVPEMIIDGHSGILCKPKDIKGITNATLNLLSNSQKRKEIGAHGRNRIINRFSFNNRLKTIEGYYQKVNSFAF